MSDNYEKDLQSKLENTADTKSTDQDNTEKKDNMQTDASIQNNIKEPQNKDTVFSEQDQSNGQTPSNDQNRQGYFGGAGMQGGYYNNSPYSPYYRHASDIGSGASYTFSNDPSFGADATPKKKKEKKKGRAKIFAATLAFVIIVAATAGGGALAAYQFLVSNPSVLSSFLALFGWQNAHYSSKSTKTLQFIFCLI